EIPRGLERDGIQGPHVTVNSTCDDRAILRNPIQILPRGIPPLRPLRFVPIDADDPRPAGRASHGLPKPGDRLGHGAGSVEPRPSQLPRTVGHVGMGIDESRYDNPSLKVEPTGAAVRGTTHLALRADGDDPAIPNCEGLRPSATR